MKKVKLWVLPAINVFLSAGIWLFLPTPPFPMWSKLLLIAVTLVTTILMCRLLLRDGYDLMEIRSRLLRSLWVFPGVLLWSMQSRENLPWFLGGAILIAAAGFLIPPLLERAQLDIEFSV